MPASTTSSPGLDLQGSQQKMENLFLAVLAHELRTPLNTISGWIKLLQKGLGEDQIARAYTVIESNLNTQNRLIEDIFDLERIRTGKLRLEMQRVTLESEIDRAVQAMRPSANAKGVALRTLIQYQAAVMADPDRLQQVITNLLANAIKFTPPGGLVQIALRSSGLGTQLTVSDNGKGITNELLPRLFEPFVTADSASVRGKSGLGLGLPLVKLLVEMHDGRIVAESAGEGHGASFTIELPLIGRKSSSFNG